jgi:hypothetical protein
MLKYGLNLLIPAIYFFIKGLDDENDYLRINHGMWHLFIGIAFFYLYQIK